ncbi:hypothetical protein HK098_001058 [Nowakowskiella sp. JEL0407]|nr:hypothetical protein HK098_001058 [Nowakowskiella sp. JEL0407]
MQNPSSQLNFRFNKNRRRNTSAMIRYMHSDGRIRNILIDCGKSFYETALQWFPPYRIRLLDAIILTHGHADAMMGLDDLRQWTIGGKGAIQKSVPIYLDSSTMDVVKRSFPYLVDTNLATGSGIVTALDFKVFGSAFDKDSLLPFKIEELEVTPFQVEHGVQGEKKEIYYSLGFKFEDITYISDTNKIPEDSYEKIKGTNLLVIDSLKLEKRPSHLSVSEAIDECLKIKPQKGFLIGFTHENLHEDLEELVAHDPRLVGMGIEVRPGYDGLRIPWNTSKS